MADIAYLFHWSLDSMAAMDVEELMHWRNLAVQRHNAVNAPPEGKG